jgi:hypothetical protein
LTISSAKPGKKEKKDQFYGSSISYHGKPSMTCVKRVVIISDIIRNNSKFDVRKCFNKRCVEEFVFSFKINRLVLWDIYVSFWVLLFFFFRFFVLINRAKF